MYIRRGEVYTHTHTHSEVTWLNSYYPIVLQNSYIFSPIYKFYISLIIGEFEHSSIFFLCHFPIHIL